MAKVPVMAAAVSALVAISRYLQIAVVGGVGALVVAVVIIGCSCTAAMAIATIVMV